MIINELITNSFKYAFHKDAQNNVSISIEKQDDYYKLTYTDNGEGLPEGFDFKSTTSLGMELIQILTDQLSGKLSYVRTPKNAFIIYFKPIASSFSV